MRGDPVGAERNTLQDIGFEMNKEALAAISPKPYLEVQGDLVRRFIFSISRIMTPVFPIINLFPKFFSN